MASPAEVIRWENQIANNRRNVIDASAQRNVAEIRLNRLLNRPLEESFQTEEANLDDPVLQTSAARLGPYLGNPFAFDIFRDFMTAEALMVAARASAGRRGHPRAGPCPDGSQTGVLGSHGLSQR